MPIPQRKIIPTSVAGITVQVTDDGSRTLVRSDTGDLYHSGCGALAETRHVYLRNSGVADRLAHRTPTSVLEIGLGTGMGLLITLDAAIASGASLRYDAYESDWLEASVLRELKLGECLVDPSLADRMIEFRDTFAYPVPDGAYGWKAFADEDGDFQVAIHVGDVRRYSFDEAVEYDAIYFDPFAPASNPDLWEACFLKKMHALLSPHGRLVTYCCSRPVRDAMQTAGFSVDRVPGPHGGKREVLIATR